MVSLDSQFLMIDENSVILEETDTDDDADSDVEIDGMNSSLDMVVWIFIRLWTSNRHCYGR